jgi:ribosomal protein S19
MQKGFSKKTSSFINWHYLFSTSTQITKFSVNFFLKNFFKNFKKIINWTNIQFSHKKWISRKFDKLNSKSGIFLWDRKLSILPQYVNKIFYIYNGTRFFKLWVVPAMVGYKFGSFSFTRRILAKDYKTISSYKNIV